MSPPIKQAGEKIRVTFLSYSYLFWDYFAPVISEMQNRSCFEPQVLLIPQVGLQKELHQDVLHPVGELAGFPLVTEKEYDITHERPDVTFHNTPYASSVETRYRPEMLLRHNTLSALVPYCTEFMGSDSFFELYYNNCRHFWRIFAASSMSRQGYMDFAKLNPASLPVTGNPEYDTVLNTPEKDLEHVQHIKKMADGRKIVLWTPHYSIGTILNWSTWTILGSDIVRLFAELSDDFFVVCRPHQLLKPLLRAWQPDRVPANFAEHLARTMHRAGNFYIDSFSRGIQSVLAADAIISDASSMITKAMSLGKSVLFTINPAGAGTGTASEIMSRYLHSATDIAGVKKFVDMLATGNDPLLPVPAEILESFCGPVDGNAATRIADNLEQAFF